VPSPVGFGVPEAFRTWSAIAFIWATRWVFIALRASHASAAFCIHAPNLKAFIVGLFVVGGFVGVRGVVCVALAAVAAGLIDSKTTGTDHLAPSVHQISAAHITLDHCNKLRAAADVTGEIRAVSTSVTAAFAVL
jgi:hypothetical protein